MYATKQDMIDRFGVELLVQLTDRAAEPTGEVDDTVLNQALGDADALINSFIGRRYDLPLATAPTVLIGHAAAIAFYTLHRGRYPEEVRTAFEDAMAFLGKLARGEALLDVAGSQPRSAVADARVEAPDRMFNRDSMKGF